MSDADLDNLDLLIDGFLNGELAESQREELAGRLERDRAAARAFDDALRTEALLHAAHVSSTVDSFASAPGINTSKVPRETLSPNYNTGRIQRANFAPARAWVAVAALVAVMFGGVIYYKHLPSVKNAEAGGTGQGVRYAVASGRVWVDGREAKTISENEWLNVSPDGPAVVNMSSELKLELEGGSGALLRKNGATPRCGRHDQKRMRSHLRSRSWFIRR